MKKLLLGILLAAFTAGNIFAQTEPLPLSQINRKDFSKWSIAIGGGYAYYRVNPFAQNAGDNFFKYYFLGEGGFDYLNPQISVEYDFNPLFGLGIHAGRFGFNRPSGANASVISNPNTLSNGKITGLNYGAVYDLTVYASIDLTDWLFPYRKGCFRKWSIYSDFGVGATYYRGDVADRFAGDVSNNVNPWPDDKFSDGVYDGISPVFTSMLKAEYSLGRRIDLGIGAGYRTYLRDGLGGYNEDVQTGPPANPHTDGNIEAINEDGFNLTLSLRWKFGSGNKTHMRDVRLTDGYNDLMAKIEAQSTPDVSPLLRRMQNIEDATAGLNNRLGDLEDKVNKLHAKTDGIDGLGTQANPWVIKGVNFEFDKTVVINKSTPVLQNVLVKLIAHYKEWNTLKIEGHTDWFGTEEYNKELALRRAEAIKQFLIDNGLGDKKFVIESFGETKPVAPNATPDGRDNPEGRQENRRAEIYVID